MSRVSVSLLNLTLLTASKKGVDRATLLSKVGISEDVLKNADNYVSCDKCSELLKLATELSGDPNFPLENGQNFTPNNFSIFGQLLSFAPDLRTAFQKSHQFKTLIGDGLSCAFEENGRFVNAHMDITAPELEEYKSFLLESCLSQIVTFLRQLTGKTVLPLEAHFQHPRRVELQAYRQIFGGDIYFNADRYTLVFHRSLLDEKIITANSELFDVFQNYAKNYLQSLVGEPELIRTVSKTIIDLMQSNTATLDNVAQKLALGTRTLQRMLQDEGQSFNKIFSKVRKDIAERHLQNSSLSISEISYMLGFAEPSIFHRSFKKWTGVTPKSFREEMPAA